MRRLLLLALPALAAPISSALRAQVRPAQASSIYISHVNVVPMDRERVIADAGVVIENGRVAAIGPFESVARPDGAVAVDAAGAYLVPGLWDMHVHFDPQREGVLGVFIANGITSVRVMWGWPGHLELRSRVARGELLGPRLVVAGTIIEGEPPEALRSVIPVAGKALVRDSVEGAREVARQHALGYDFIKVYNNVPAAAYAGVMAEARRLGLPVAGHVPFAVGLRGAVAAGQRSIEHLRGYEWYLVPQNAPHQPGMDLRSRTLAWSDADLSKIDSLAAWSKAAGVWNTPTLAVTLVLKPQVDLDRYLASEEARHLGTEQRRWFTDRLSIPWLSNFSEDDFRIAYRGLAMQDSLIRALVRTGAKILAGTDTQPLGFALHRELEELVRAGLTPFQALEAATRNPAEFFRFQDGSGVVAVGSPADLVLLEGNPLEDVRQTRRIVGVVSRGRWLDRGALQRLLSASN